jgi:hypothetical protein
VTHPKQDSGGGKDLEVGGLAEIAKGVTAALAALRGTGLNVDDRAVSGRGFDALELSGLELGHQGLTDTFKSFCGRWEWGVRGLMVEGNNFAEEVGLSAGVFYENDQYVQGTLKIGVNALIGNPDASSDEVSKMGWGDLVEHHNAFSHADYSAGSFKKAWAASNQAWDQAGRDVMTSHVVGPVPGLDPEDLHRAFGVSDQSYDKWLDSTFGPSAQQTTLSPVDQGGSSSSSGSGVPGQSGQPRTELRPIKPAGK